MTSNRTIIEALEPLLFYDTFPIFTIGTPIFVPLVHLDVKICVPGVPWYTSYYFFSYL